MRTEEADLQEAKEGPGGAKKGEICKSKEKYASIFLFFIINDIALPQNFKINSLEIQADTISLPITSQKQQK